MFVEFDKKNGLNKGFTLIELLVVISIIGLLSSVILGGLALAREKAKGSWAISQMKQIQNALELYKLDYGYYPYQMGMGGDPESPNGIDAIFCGGTGYEFVASLTTKLVPKYISKINDNINHTDNGVCWYDMNILTPSFEYETDDINSYATCGARAFGPYALLIMSPFPIPGLNKVIFKGIPEGSPDTINYYYCITPTI